MQDLEYCLACFDHLVISLLIPVVEVTMAEESPLMAGLLGIVGWAAV